MSIKEWFKSKPYWLKGGVLTLLIVLIIDILTRTLSPFASWIENPNYAHVNSLFLDINAIFYVINTLIHLPTLFLLDTFPATSHLVVDVKNTFSYVNIYIVPVSLLLWFLIGSFICWTIGKIKSKKG